MTIDRLSRRHALTGAAVVGVSVPVLAACSDEAGGTAEDVAGQASEAASEGASKAGEAASEAADALTRKTDIPEGGGKVFPDAKVVVTQPTAGEFKAFTAVCTHQGCTVTTVSDNTITCPCHNSTFSAQDGTNILGPQPEQAPNSLPGLDEVAITVDGDSISLA